MTITPQDLSSSHVIALSAVARPDGARPGAASIRRAAGVAALQPNDAGSRCRCVAPQHLGRCAMSVAITEGHAPARGPTQVASFVKQAHAVGLQTFMAMSAGHRALAAPVSAIRIGAVGPGFAPLQSMAEAAQAIMGRHRQALQTRRRASGEQEHPLPQQVSNPASNPTSNAMSHPTSTEVHTEPRPQRSEPIGPMQGLVKALEDDLGAAGLLSPGQGASAGAASGVSFARWLGMAQGNPALLSAAIAEAVHPHVSTAWALPLVHAMTLRCRIGAVVG